MKLNVSPQGGRHYRCGAGPGEPVKDTNYKLDTAWEMLRLFLNENAKLDHRVGVLEQNAGI